MKFSTKVKAIDYSMDFAHGIRRALIMALALVYFVYLGFNVVAVTTLFAVSNLVGMFMEFPTGAVADYDSRKKSLMISYLLFAVAFFGIFFTNNFWMISGFWILSEIAWTFSTGAGGAWSIDALGIGKKKKEIVRLVSRGYLFEKSGHIVGGLIGLIIIGISFRLIWLVGGLVYLIMLLVIWKYMEERNFTPSKVPHGYIKKSFIKAKESYEYIFHEKGRNLRVFMSGDFLISIGLGMFFVGMPLMFTQVLGLNPEHLAGLLAGLAMLSLVSPLIAEKITHKKGFGKTLFGIVFIMGISIVVFSLSGSLIYAIGAFAILQIFDTAHSVVSDSGYAHSFESKIRASLGSIGSINWYVANSVGVFLAGVSIGIFGIVSTLVVSGVVTFLTAFVYLFGVRD